LIAKSLMTLAACTALLVPSPSAEANVIEADPLCPGTNQAGPERDQRPVQVVRARAGADVVGGATVTGLLEKLTDAGRSLQNVFANPGLRRVELAFAGSIVGDWAYAVAVALYAFEHGGATAVGVLGVIRYLSLAIVTPLTSTLADRYPRRLVMISSDISRAVLVFAAAALIESNGPSIAVYVLAITTAIFGSPFRSAQASLLPQLARDPGELAAANVASSTVESIGFFAGPALAGLLLAVTGIPVVYALNALTFPVVGRARVRASDAHKRG